MIIEREQKFCSLFLTVTFFREKYYIYNVGKITPVFQKNDMIKQ